MNNAFNLYDLKNFKAVGSDLVTSWVGDLLSKEDGGETVSVKQSAQILSYPVENILTPEFDGQAAAAFPDKTPVFNDIRIVPSIRSSVFSDFAAKIDPEKEISYFTFISRSSFYALPSLNINEILKYKEPVNIFSRKPGHLGIIPYRNKMAPVYDFSVIVSGMPDIKSGLKYIIACIYKNKFFGLSVQGIQKIVKIKNKALISPSTFKFRNSNNISSDVFEDEEGKFCSVIDLESLYAYLTS